MEHTYVAIYWSMSLSLVSEIVDEDTEKKTANVK